MSDFVAESGHWYTPEGAPAYTQITASGKNKGKERPTTLRDAKRLGLVPSVTTVIGILDKPALTHWLIKRAVQKATDPENYKENTAAEEGTRIHGIIERWIDTKTLPLLKGGRQYISTVKEVFDKVGVLHPVSERSFASPDFGGAVDAHDKEANVIIDFKTKDITLEDALAATEGKKRMTYDDHVMQLAAYREGLGMQGAKCYNLFLSRVDPKAYYLHKWEDAELDRGWQMFQHLKEFWKLRNGYNPQEVSQ